MVEMNKKGQFFIIGGVILSIGLILFFLLGFSSQVSDNSYLAVFKMKDVKNSIESCLVCSLNSNSNLSEKLEMLKNNYKDEGIEINYKKIVYSNIKYEAKNLTFNFSLYNGNFSYNISNHGFGESFNGSLNVSNPTFSKNLSLNISENSSVAGSFNISGGDYAKVFIYDRFGNLILNETIYNNTNCWKLLYYYILNVSKEGDFAIFIMAKNTFNNSLAENVSFINTSGYFNSYLNKTYINISINGSFSGILYVKSSQKNYTVIINSSSSFIFNDTIPPINIELLNNYSDVVFNYNLNESINNFTDTSYFILNESCKNNYFNVIYGNSSMLYVSLHSKEFNHNITIFNPQKGISSKGFVLADISIITPRMFYSSLNNSFEYQSWNIG
ncbi:conserved hypothetical protein [Methanocaldococcus sp. FS406-22]|nr:conserved hypothetical protein [Methanocaldococcus sp. FS406-22]